MTVIIRNCELCETPCKKQCPNCKSVFYCSADHQTKMWRFHRYLCEFIHLDFIRQPDFKANEARAILCTLGDIYQDRDENASQAQLDAWLKQDEEVVKNFDKSIKDEFENNEVGRNSKITAVRSKAQDIMTDAQKISLNRRNEIGAFYGVANLVTFLSKSSSTIYNHPYFLQNFQQQCFMDLLVDSMRAPVYLVAVEEALSAVVRALKKLEMVTRVLEESGTDTDGIYRGNTNLLQDAHIVVACAMERFFLSRK